MRSFCAASLLFFCLSFLIALLPSRAQTTPSPSGPTQIESAHQTGKPAAATAPNPPQSAAPANPQTPAEFFARARQLSDLEAAGIPFHLKATFVASGDAEFKGNGTYEEWWKDKGNWRKEATQSDFKYIAFKTSNGDSKIYTTSDDLPSPLQNILDGFLVNIPTDAGTFGKWKMQQKKIEKAKLFRLEQKGPCVPDQKSAVEKCLEQGFFTPEGLIRIQVVNGVTTVYNDFRLFRGDMIPYTIFIGNQKDNVKVSINLLEPLDTNVSFAEVPPGLHPFQDTAFTLYKPGRDVKPPVLMHRVDAQFPPSMQNVQQSVTIEMIIDRRGTVQDARVTRSGGVAFDDAALRAVRHYKFAPATYRGKPVAVKMVIDVNFRKF